MVGTQSPHFKKTFNKKTGVRFFPQKERGWKNRGVLRKGEINYFLTNAFQCYLFLSVWCGCVRLVYSNHFY